MKNSFYLVIPKQEQAPLRLKEFEAKSLQQWLDELPAANLGLATRLIHDFIQELNTIAMPSQLRLDVLERIRPNVRIIEDYLQARLVKTGFPKDDTENKIFEVLISLQKECAIGYWTIIRELTHRDVSWLKGQNTTLPIQRCIKKLALIVSSHFIMGFPVPDWVWIDLHSLYKLNAKLNQGTATLVKHFKQRATTYTADDCYKQILLLSLADTTGLAQKDIPLVFGFIETIASLLSFKPVPVVQQTKQCLVLTDEDKPPFFLDDVNKEPDSTLVYLDFTGIYKFFNDQEKQAGRREGKFLTPLFGGAATNTKLPPELLLYLQQRWFGVELHGSSLFVDRLDRFVAIGLSLTHDMKTPAYIRLEAEGSDEKKEDFLAQTASDKLLTAVFKEPGVLSVGSLVSIRGKNEPENNRQLGLVNKINVVNHTGKLVFGIQLITTRFYAVFCKQRQAGNNDAPQKGLLFTLRDKGGVGEKNYIITDYFMFEDNDIVDLSMEKDDFPVIMKNRRNIGLGYWQFECQRCAEQTKVERAKKGYDFI